MTSAPTPVTMSAISQPSVSMRIDSESPSDGIQAYDSVSTSPETTRGVCSAVYTNAMIGTSAATKKPRGPSLPISHGSASGKTANATRSTSKRAS